jgi:hypothetical protein
MRVLSYLFYLYALNGARCNYDNLQTSGLSTCRFAMLMIQQFPQKLQLG